MARTVSLERRRELALAAFEVIRARGLYGITMSELAAQLGLKRSTAYWYFRDLGHVFEIVLEHTLERQKAFLTERLLGGTTASGLGVAPLGEGDAMHPVDALFWFAEGVWDFFTTEGPYLLQLVSFWGHTVGGEPGRVIEVTQRHFQPMWQLAVSELERGVKLGQVARCNARAVVDLVTALVDGALVHRVVRGLEVGPVGTLLWDAVLGPLRLPPRQAPPWRTDPQGKLAGQASDAGVWR